MDTKKIGAIFFLFFFLFYFMTKKLIFCYSKILLYNKLSIMKQNGHLKKYIYLRIMFVYEYICMCMYFIWMCVFIFLNLCDEAWYILFWLLVVIFWTVVLIFIEIIRNTMFRPLYPPTYLRTMFLNILFDQET